MDDSIEDYISKEMNIKLKKRKILIKDTDKEIMKTLKKKIMILNTLIFKIILLMV